MHGLRFHEARRRLIESLSQIIPEHFACQRDYTSIACILKDHRSRRIILLPACSFFIFVLSLGLIQETYLYVGLAVTISIVALISLFNALIYSIRKQHEASEVVKAVSNVCQRYSSFIQEQEAQLTLSMGARANSGAEEQALSCNPHISVVPTYRDGSWHRLPTLLLVAGDVIALMAGDLAPGRVQEIVAGGSRGGGKGTGGLYTGTTVSLGAVLERGARLRNRSVSSSYRRHRLLPADSPELLLLSGDIRCFRLLESICSAFCQEMLQSSSESATLDSADGESVLQTNTPTGAATTSMLANNTNINQASGKTAGKILSAPKGLGDDSHLRQLCYYVSDQSLYALLVAALVLVPLSVARLFLFEETNLYTSADTVALGVLVPFGSLLLCLSPISLPIVLCVSEAMAMAGLLATTEAVLHLNSSENTGDDRY